MLFGQEKIAQYYSSYFLTSYDIFASKPDSDGNYHLMIYSQTSDDSNSLSGLVLINKTQVDEFKNFLIYLRSMYVKWRKIAIENNVKEFSKIVEYKNTNYQGGFYNTEWHFDFDVNFTPMFRIDSGKYLMAIVSDKLVSTLDSDITSQGFMIVLSSSDEFDNLLNGISEGKVISFYNSKKNKEELFK